MSRWQDFCTLHDVPILFQNPRVGQEADKDAYELLDAWLEEPTSSLFLSGPPGRGKTYATYYLVSRMIERRSLADFRVMRSEEIDQRMLDEVRKWGTNADFVKILSEIPYLFIDDFGVEPDTDRMQRTYYSFLDKRWSHQRPTIISTNVSRSMYETIFGSRISSRLQTYDNIRFDKGDLRRL